MQTDHARAPGKRSGFTLIEMLVVLAIILTLSVLTVLFMPRIQERQKVARGADMLQGWLFMAKQRALRDRVPTGVRLQPSARNSNWAQDLQYIQKPDDYAPLATNSSNSYLCLGPSTQDSLIVSFGQNVNLYGSGKGDPGDDANLVQKGDYLQLRGEGLVHRINDITQDKAIFTCSLGSPTGLTPPCTFRIIRQPRLVPGEQPLQLPQDVAVDVSPGKSWHVPPRQPFAGEILFSPSGRVVGQGTGNSPIVLWVRDVTQDPNTPGDQTLIVIYPRTGLIASHPVSHPEQPTADHYEFIRDGRSSGF